MNPVVIDTNCLLQIIARKSPYRPIWDAFLEGRFDLCVSNEIWQKLREKLLPLIKGDERVVLETLSLMLYNC
jgi:predicted nucleic acid-binding protein